jgi:ubiquinone/menaquinone biosynthesis C-methylase UbiE
MKVSRIETWLVRRKAKGGRATRRVKLSLDRIEGPPARDVLELGCGTGVASAFLANECRMNVVGTDFDRERIERARALFPESDRLRFAVEDATRLDFGDARFDLVVAQNVFHHVSDWRSAVRESARVLRPGGHLIWLDMIAPPLVLRLLGRLLHSHHRNSHDEHVHHPSSDLARFTLDEILASFEADGLKVRFCERIRHALILHHHLLLEKSRV